MNETSSAADPGHTVEREHQLPRTIYVLPEEALTLGQGYDLSLREVFDVLWQGKWRLIAVTAVFAIASAAYAFLATEWYRAEVLLAPVEDQSMPDIAGELGGLAALAGVKLDTGNSAEAVATLKSSEFARDFIDDFNLTPVFFSDDWDQSAGRWRQDDPESWPDVRDAVEYFHDDLLDVDEDFSTGLVTMTVDWTDPEVAAKWADILIVRLNAKLRERALREAQVNVGYLQAELGKTNLVALQDSIGRLLENELQKLMLARGNKEFAFRTIDRSGPPKYRVWPRRILVLLLGTTMGGIVGVLWLFLGRALGSRRPGAVVGP